MRIPFVRRTVSLLIYSLYRSLPQKLRHAICRRLVSLNLSPPQDLKIKIAQTRSEMEQAFRLLHSTYVRSGLMKAHPSGLRCTKYHVLPTTLNIVAMLGEKVIGTLAIIQDGPLGLPLDKFVQLTALRNRGERIAEISSLAVDPLYRDKHQTVVFLLTKFMWAYCRRFRLDRLIAAVHPSHADFYEGILLFERLIPNALPSYDFANGKPALALTLVVNRAEKRFHQVYATRPASRNVWQYYTQENFPHLKITSSPYHRAFEVSLREEDLAHFLSVNNIVTGSLTAREIRAVANQYPTLRRGGRATRFAVCCPARVLFRSRVRAPIPPLTGHVGNVSRTGLYLVLPEKLNLGEPVELSIEVGSEKELRVQGRVRWVAEGRHGVEIESVDFGLWNSLVDHLHAQFSGESEEDLFLNAS